MPHTARPANTLDDVTALTAELNDQLHTAQEVAREAHTLAEATRRDVLNTETAARAARTELAKVDGFARLAEHAAETETETATAAELERSAATLAELGDLR